MKVKVRFYGVIAEIAEKGTGIYEDVKTTEHLEQRIINEYPEIFHYKYNLALNDTFINSHHPLKDGDEVALVPPFEGG